MDSPETPAPPAANDAPAAPRRPYERPNFQSFPLFERMALTCTANLKQSPEEDAS